MAAIRNEWPYVYVLSNEVTKNYCAYCFKRSPELKNCAKCKFCHYCNQTCQKMGWDDHKTECKFLKKYAGQRVPDGQTRLIARIIFKLKKEDIGQTVIDGEDRSFLSLLSHSEEIAKAEERIRNPQSYKEQAVITASINSLIARRAEGVSFSHRELVDHLRETFPEAEHIAEIMRGLHYIQFDSGLREYLGEYILDMDPAEILDIYGKVCINSFGIDDEYNRPIGTGLYIQFSILDHSCDPDLVFNFDGPRAFLVPVKENLQNIPLRELRISYLESGLLKEKRQERLKGRYYFICDCPHCNNHLREEKMTSLNCSDQNCSGMVVNKDDTTFYSCLSCGSKKEISSEVEEIVMEHEELLDKINRFCQDGETVSAYKIVKDALPKYIQELHPVNRLRADLLLRLSSLAKEMGKKEESVNCLEEAVLSDIEFSPQTSPSFLVSQIELARLFLLIRNRKKAEQYASKALEIAEVLHGKKSTIFSEIKELLRRAKKKQ